MDLFDFASANEISEIPSAQVKPKCASAIAVIDESALTQDEQRKLHALRKSVGDDLAEDIFAKWHKRQSKPARAEKSDPSGMPSFLIRSKGEAQPRRNHRPGRIKWIMPKLPHSQRPPKSKTFRGAEKVTIHLADECKAIGSGVRVVWAKRGRKWVYLCDAMNNRGRLSLAVFNRICVLAQS